MEPWMTVPVTQARYPKELWRDEFYKCRRRMGETRCLQLLVAHSEPLQPPVGWRSRPNSECEFVLKCVKNSTRGLTGKLQGPCGSVDGAVDWKRVGRFKILLRRTSRRDDDAKSRARTVKRRPSAIRLSTLDTRVEAEGGRKRRKGKDKDVIKKRWRREMGRKGEKACLEM